MGVEVDGAKSGRLLSLDVFRGATIAAMLLVNNPGDWGHVFPPLRHAKWHGCTATDLIFPFFLFIMGTAMAFSLGKRLAAGAGPKALLASVFRRSLLLFVLGSLITFFAMKGLHKPHYPVMGVLQRIALCYLFASLVMMISSIRGQLGWAMGLLAAHYALLKWTPFPGGSAGTLDMYANFADWFDTRLLGRHLGDFSEELQMGHDAEGILGTLSAIATTLTGVLCGHWLRDSRKTGHEKVAGMSVIGTTLVALSLLWQYDIPLNKNLWTPSYVLHTSGWALLCLGGFYWSIDILGWKGWTKPFLVYGVNPITAYFGASVMAYTTVWIRWNGPDGQEVMLKYYLYDHIYKSWVPSLLNHTVSSACWGMTYVVLWCGLMWILYRKRIFIKV